MSALTSHISNIHEAKTRLSQLVHFAEMGEEVVICRDGEPKVKLVPITAAPKQKRRAGQLRGKIQIAEDFDALPDILKSYFETEND